MIGSLDIEKLQTEIKKLKGIYKDYGGKRDYDELDENEKEEKSSIYQSLLEKEYELQEIKKRIAGVAHKEPQKGDWMIVKSKWGYKRVKLAEDNNCGWGL